MLRVASAGRSWDESRAGSARAIAGSPSAAGTRPVTGMGFYTSREAPRIVKPPDGLLWTANTRVVDGPMLAQIGFGDYDRGCRAGMIRDRLRALDQATEADMLSIQLDDRAVFLERWRKLLLDLLRPEVVSHDRRRLELKTLLENWGGRASVDSAGYRLVWEIRLRIVRARALTSDRPLSPGRSAVSIGRAGMRSTNLGPGDEAPGPPAGSRLSRLGFPAPGHGRRHSGRSDQERPAPGAPDLGRKERRQDRTSHEPGLASSGPIAGIEHARRTFAGGPQGYAAGPGPNLRRLATDGRHAGPRILGLFPYALRPERPPPVAPLSRWTRGVGERNADPVFARSRRSHTDSQGRSIALIRGGRATDRIESPHHRTAKDHWSRTRIHGTLDWWLFRHLDERSRRS